MPPIPPSRAFKITLTGVATIVGLLLMVQPYLGLVQKVNAQESYISSLKAKTETDHDLIIQMSADMNYVKRDLEYIKDYIKESRRQNQSNNSPRQ